MFLRNNTLLPVQWKLSGLDVLGNDFSFNQEHGIVQPKSEFELKVHFRASKANNYKRALKLEVSHEFFVQMYISAEPIKKLLFISTWM